MKNRVNWLCWFFSGVIVLFLAGQAYGEKGNDKTLSPYFFIAGGDSSVDQFPLKETNVVVHINGVIADIYVTQTYANEGTRPISGPLCLPRIHKGHRSMG